jgi:ataxia telangiectasia mutated family protein
MLKLHLFSQGSWSAEACLEKPTDILAHFFDPAIQLISGITADSLQPCHASAYHQCAIFAEHQYHSIVKSPDGLRWKVYMDRKTQEIQDREVEILKSQRDNATMGKLKDYQDKAKKQLEQDKQSFSLHEDARQKFLRQAIYMCARCLEISDSFNDDAAIRLCSLWFANFSDNGLQDVVKEALDRVASRKLVFLAHQLSARMSTTEAPQLEESQLHLQDLMLRMCREHPFHSLYQVYCLRADRSGVKSDAPRRSSSRLESPASQSARAAAASNIWDKLSQDSTNAERVRAVEIVCDACLEWAKLPIKANPRFNAKNGKKAGLSIPQSVKILSIKSMRVPVVTVHTPLDPTLRYSDCTWIEGYDPTFDIAGGVNLPKITRCIGSDGLKYKQLVRRSPSSKISSHSRGSSKVRARMTCVKMRLWSRSLTSLIWCCGATGKREDVISASDATKSSL